MQEHYLGFKMHLGQILYLHHLDRGSRGYQSIAEGRICPLENNLKQIWKCDTLLTYLVFFMMKKMKAPPLPCHSVGRHWKKALHVSQEFFHGLETWTLLVPLS